MTAAAEFKKTPRLEFDWWRTTNEGRARGSGGGLGDECHTYKEGFRARDFFSYGLTRLEDLWDIEDIQVRYRATGKYVTGISCRYGKGESDGGSVRMSGDLTVVRDIERFGYPEGPPTRYFQLDWEGEEDVVTLWAECEAKGAEGQRVVQPFRRVYEDGEGYCSH